MNTAEQPLPPVAIGLALLLVLLTPYVPLVVIMGIFVGIICRVFPRLSVSVLILGLVLSTITFLVIPLGITVLLSDQHQALMRAITSGEFWTFATLQWTSSLPLALCLGSGMSLLIGQPTRMQKLMRDVGKGKVTPRAKKLPEKAIQRALNRITTSAIEGGSILGINQVTGEAVSLMDKDANLHTFVVGTTGSGKTVTLCNIIESVISRGLGLIFLDGKGDTKLAKRIEAFAKQQNRKFYCFNMRGHSHRYNPIANGGITSKKDRIIELRHWSEDHYRKIAEGYLQTVFQMLDRFNIQTDLSELANYLRADSFYTLARENKDAEAIRLIESLEAKERDVSSLLCEIENMVNSELGELFKTGKGNAFTLKQAIEENAVIYFCLQPLAFPAYAECLGKLIINDIKALTADFLATEQSNALYCIFDEFSVFAGDQVINLINQGRGAGIHAVLSTQSLSDLESKGGEAFIGQVINNCNNFIIQRQNYHEDAERCAQIAGTCDDVQITSKVESQTSCFQTGSVRLTKEFVIHPDAIKCLEVGDVFTINKLNTGACRVKIRCGQDL